MNTSEAEVEDTDAIASAVQLVSLGKAPSISETTALIQSCLEHLAAIPARQHPLGFLHLDLSDVSGRAGARLHVWDASFMTRADPLGRLHDHQWELRSAVLLGHLIDRALDPVADTEGDYTAHRVNYVETGNRLEPVAGRWSLHEREARELQRGDFYSLASRVVHATEIVTIPTATLVTAIDQGGPGPLVFTPRAHADFSAARRPSVPTGDVASALQSVLRILTTEV